MGILLDQSGNNLLDESGANLLDETSAALSYLRPDGTAVTGSWLTDAGGTDLHTAIDETTASDTDYIESGASPDADISRITLSDPTGTVDTAQAVTISYRYKKAGTRAVNLTVRLKEGTITRASWTHSGLTSSYLTANQTLTTLEKSAITNWSNLELEFEATGEFSITRHGTFIDTAPGDLAVSRSDDVDVGTAATGRRIWFFGAFVFGGGGGNETVTMDGQTMTRIPTARGEVPVFYLDSDTVGGTVTISITDPENEIWPIGGVVYSSIGHSRMLIAVDAINHPATPAIRQFEGGATIGIGMHNNGGSTTWSPNDANKFINQDLRTNEYMSAWEDLDTSDAPATAFSVSNALSAPQVALVCSIGGPVPFVPTDVSGLLLWLDADDATTITDTTGDVSQWDDKSGNAHHVSQGTGANQPRTGDATINGRNVLSFTAANSEYLFRTDALGLTGSPALTAFVVKKANATTTDGAFLAVGEGPPNVSVGDIIKYGQNSSNPRISFNNGNRVFNYTNTVNTEIFLYETPASATHADHELRVNGGAVEAQASVTSPTNTISLVDVYTLVGASYGGGSLIEYWDGDIAEILVYEAPLSAGDKNAIGQYLADKWRTEWEPISFAVITNTFTDTNDTDLTAHIPDDGESFIEVGGSGMTSPYVWNNHLVSGQEGSIAGYWVQNGRPAQANLAVNAEVSVDTGFTSELVGVCICDTANYVQYVIRYAGSITRFQVRRFGVDGNNLYWEGDEAGVSLGNYTMTATPVQLRLEISGTNLIAEIDGVAVAGSPFDISGDSYVSGKPGVYFRDKANILNDLGLILDNYEFEG